MATEVVHAMDLCVTRPGALLVPQRQAIDVVTLGTPNVATVAAPFVARDVVTTVAADVARGMGATAVACEAPDRCKQGSCGWMAAPYVGTLRVVAGRHRCWVAAQHRRSAAMSPACRRDAGRARALRRWVSTLARGLASSISCQPPSVSTTVPHRRSTGWRHAARRTAGTRPGPARDAMKTTSRPRRLRSRSLAPADLAAAPTWPPGWDQLVRPALYAHRRHHELGHSGPQRPGAGSWRHPG